MLASVVHSQEALHASFGGVVPELAAREHLQRLPPLVDLALERAGARADELELVAVTRGPGLVGCLLVKPHALRTGDGREVCIQPGQTWCVITSAVEGDTHVTVYAPEIASWERHKVFVTRHWCDAEWRFPPATACPAGGQPVLSTQVLRVSDRQPLPKPALPGLEYSFSGLKTALLYRLRDIGEPSDQQRADLAAAFERSVVESLLQKLQQALAEWPVGEVVVCGGVAANTLLRRRAAEVLDRRARLTIPPFELCTDNAAMIAAAAADTPEAPVAADPGLSW